MVDVNGDVFRRKRKNVCQNLVFEVNDSDFSPETSPQPADTFETCGPSSKLPRCQEQVSSFESVDSGFSQISQQSAEGTSAAGREIGAQIEEGEIEEGQDATGPSQAGAVVQIDISDSGCIHQAHSAASTSTTSINIDVNVQTQRATNECVFPAQAERSDPAISVAFRDETIADRCRDKLVQFFASFAGFEVKTRDDAPFQLEVHVDESLGSDGWAVIDDLETFSPHRRKHHHHKKSKRKAKKELLFEVDTEPKIAVNERQSLQYSTKFTIIGDDEKLEAAAADTRRGPPPAQTCFNCGEGHSLRDCPHPRNTEKINTARQKFRQNQIKPVRYHLEEDQKYGHLSPGRISENLRKALNLGKNELPPYIYRMRVLGYPPGWIEEAKYTCSELCMFGSDGQSVESDAKKRGQMDRDKIIDYPGFNVPMEGDCKDEYTYYNVPQYSEQFSKQAMLDYIQRMEEALEMPRQFEEKDENSKDEEKSQQNDTSFNQKRNRTPSPSLNDLEKEKQQLLSQLGNGNKNLPELDESGDLTSNCDRTREDETANDISIAEVSSPAVVKMSSLGTPILKNSSPYARLPNPDNFSVNMSPLINFENLPNSTGKYEQMTEILQRVRCTMKGQQQSEKSPTS